MCVYLSVSLQSTSRTVRPTDLNFGTHIKGHDISDEFEGQGQRSRSPRSENVKIPVFSLVSENMVQGQNHEVKVIGQGQRSSSKVVNQAQSRLGGFLRTPPHPTRWRLDTQAFSL